jgi:hypothetical protein
MDGLQGDNPHLLKVIHASDLYLTKLISARPDGIKVTAETASVATAGPDRLPAVAACRGGGVGRRRRGGEGRG